MFDRYSLTINEGVIVDQFGDVNIDDEDFSRVTLSTVHYDFYNTHREYNFDNATYDYLVTFYTKPSIIRADAYQNFDLYHTSIGYIKTKDNQIIFDLETMNAIDTLDRHKGLLNFLDVYFIVYDDVIRISIESVFHSLPNNVLVSTLKGIFYNHFINHEWLDIFTDTNIVKDYTPHDFENIFNSSNRNKKVVFLLDGTDDMEIVNSGRMEYSLTHSINLESTMTWLRGKLNGNIRRYSIKCEDSSDNSTAALMGYPGSDIQLHDWVQPARLVGVDTEDENGIQSIVTFLEY